MCMSTPSIPKPEPMPDPAPAPPPAQEPPAPAPPAELVNADAGEAAKIKQPKTKRQQLQQASQGTNALKIPMNTGGEKKPAGGLNIPT